MTGLEANTDPMRVFTEAYWESIHDAPRELPHHFAVRGQRDESESLLAELAPKIVSGEVTGHVLVRGRFNPNDSDLGRTSPHNMPGVVLLVDSEYLRPLESYDEKNSASLPNTEGHGNPADQAKSPRHLLNVAKEVTEYQHVHYHNASINYSNNTHRYIRCVRITQLLRTRRGLATPYDMTFCCVPFAPDQERDPQASVRPWSNLRYDAQIGETYDRFEPYRRKKPAMYAGLMRFSSMEICLSGTPAIAKSPAWSTALGRLAHNGN